MMKSLLANMKVRIKMFLAVVTLIIPLFFLSVQFYWKTSEDIHSARLEIGGVAYISPLQKLLYHLQRRRGYTALHNPGIADSSAAFKTETEAGKQALVELETAHTINDTRFNVEAPWADFKAKVQYLLDTQLNADKQKLIALHADTIKHLLAFQAIVSEKSTMDLDPDAGAYYLIELTQRVSAPLSETLGQLRYSGSLLLSNGARDLRSLAKIEGLYGIARYRAEYIDQVHQRITENNPDKKAELDKAFEQQGKAADAFAAMHTRLITEGRGGQGDARTYFAVCTDYVDALYQMNIAGNRILTEKLTSRRRMLMMKQWTVLALTLLGVGLSALVGRYIINQISNSLNRAMTLSESLSTGNLEQQIVSEGNDEIGAFMRSLQIMSHKLRSVLQQVHDSATEISLAAGQVASTAEMLNNGAMDQAAHVEETGAALGEMVGLIQSNAKNAVETDNTANTAVKNTQIGADNVMQAVESMKEISERIQIVQEIASQTNLLALNATIEAARAGEHGRGFAVVATEVGKLADTSGQAAKQIQTLLKQSSAISESAASSLSLITTSMKDTAEKVVAIRQASEEQNQAAKQISESMGRLNQTTEQTASAAEELAATAEEMSSQTSALLENLKFFNFGGSSGHVAAGYSAANTIRKLAASAAPRQQPKTAPPSGSAEPLVINSGSYEKF